MKWIKALGAGLLAGTLLACLAFPVGIKDFSSSLAALLACLLSVAVTTSILHALRWPRVSSQLRLSIVTLSAGGAILSIGLGLFLWRLTLRLSEIFTVSLPVSSAFVLTGAIGYFSVCYYLLVTTKMVIREAPQPVPLHQANRDQPTIREIAARASSNLPTRRAAK
jgi:hypothetical protein